MCGLEKHNFQYNMFRTKRFKTYPDDDDVDALDDEKMD